MSSINVRFTGYADFRQVRAELAALQKQVATVQAQANSAATAAYKKTGATDAASYRQMETAMQRMSATYRDAAASTGLFEVSQSRVNSATQTATKLLQSQKLSLLDAIKSRKTLNAVYEEQLRLQRMSVTSFRTDLRGNVLADVTVPKELPRELDTLTNKIGFYNKVLQSSSTQMVNWGKNMQWAGRQLMVGLTLPVAAFGAVAATMAYKANKSLTDIAKVYDTTQHKAMDVQQQMASNNQELAQVQADAFNVAKQAAADYGASMTDTLNTAAQLAATGLKGSELMASTTQVMRIATLGDIDYNTALNATISLQSVFHDSAKKLGEDFNYMNAVENATSLQMKDFAAAIPIAAAPVREMGGDIRTLGTLLVAMRSHGIQAVQGANAIKSAVGRLFNPSAKVEDSFQALTGVSIEDVRKQANDQIIPIFKRLYELTANIPKDARMGLLSQLFGTYQRTRLVAILQGMKDLANNYGQVARAAQVAGLSNQKTLQIANQEIARQAESASGQFKRMIEKMKIGLAEMGKPFLEFGVSVVGVIVKVISAFNSLPGGVKKAAAITTFIVAMIGPITMLVGLFMNMVGTIGRFIGGLVGLAARFNLVNKEEGVAAKVAELTIGTMERQTTATEALVGQVNALAAAFSEATRAQTLMLSSQRQMGAAALYNIQGYGHAPGGPQGRVPAGMPGAGQFLPGTRQWITPGPTIPLREGLEGPTEQSSKYMQKMAISGGVFAAAMAASLISSNKLVDTLANVAMLSALLVPTLKPLVGLVASIGKLLYAQVVVNLIKARAWATALAMNFKAISLASLATGSKAVMSNFLRIATSGPAIAVAVAAAGYAMYKFWQNSKKASDEIKHIYSDTSGLSDIIGYTPIDNASVNTQGQSVVSQASKANEFAKTYADVVQRIQEAGKGLNYAQSQQKEFNVALVQGWKVINSGGTADQARDAVKLALTAALGYTKAHSIMIHFKPQLDFEGLAAQINAAAVTVKQAANDMFSQINDKGFFEKHISEAFRSDFLHPFSTSDQVNKQASNASKAAGEEAANAWSQGFIAAQARNSPSAETVMLKQLDSTLDMFRQKIAAAQKAGDQDQVARLANLRESFETSILSAQGVKNAADVTDHISGMADSLMLAGKASIALTRQQKLMALSAIQAVRPLTQWEQNYKWLLLHGPGINKDINDAVKGWFGVSSATNSAKDKTDQYGDAVTAAAQKLSDMQKAMQKVLTKYDWVSGFKTAMQGAQQSIASQIGDAFQAQEQQAMDSLQAQGQARLDAMDKERDARLKQYDREEDALQTREKHQTDELEKQQDSQMNAFEARWKTRIDSVTKAYDSRIAAVTREMNLEKKQEDARQKMFEAQISRMQQLADMANRNIDFNVALNSGNLDQAAQIRNDANAQQVSDALQGAADKAQSASDNLQASLQKTIDKLNKQKDTQLKNLQKIEDAQKKALEAEQKRQQDALKAEQDRLEKSLAAQRSHYEDLMDIRRKAAEDDINQNQVAEQKVWDMRKAGLDRALDAFNSYIPTSQADLQRWIALTGQKYTQFGDVLKEHGKDWGQIIGDALSDNVRDAALGLKSDINWAGISTDAARQMAMAAFGMTLPQFKKWVGLDAKTQASQTQPPHHIGMPGDRAHHDGGPVAGRTGVAGKAPLIPSEVWRLLKTDEYVVDGRTHRSLGTGFFDGLKNYTRKATDHMPAVGGHSDSGMGGGRTGLLGLAGTLAAGMGHAINRMMGAGFGKAISDFVPSFGAAPSGMYGNLKLNAEQLGNASTIATVGKSMGATSRDIVVALMTAIQESMLRNLGYGDGSSVGLFQQTASWPGTVAQHMNPQWASRSFFEHLLALPNRNAMSYTQEAQAVQRSAYPDAYAKWQTTAEAILAAMRTFGGTGMALGGGKFKPVRGGYISQGLHDQDTGYPAIDIGVPIGTPVYAAAGGRVKVSKDLVGYEPRIQHQNGYFSYGKYMVVESPTLGQQLYAHLSQRGFGVGATVRGGQRLATSGLTGHTYGPHLHFGSTPLSPFAFWNAQIPHMSSGGTMKWDNTLANLHKKETVLTEPLSESLKRGIAQIEAGGMGDVNIHVHPSPGMDEEQLATRIAGKITAIQRRQASRTGNTRRVQISA